MRIDRRSLLRTGLALAAAGAAAPAFAAAPEISRSRLVAIARKAVAENAARIRHSDLVALVDFSAPSWRSRFHLVDLVAGEVSSFLTAHGRGSDPGHTGWLQKFSNEPGSYATSEGAYLTGAEYDGKYGRAMRLAGLGPDNSNAEARAIVIHAAWYVGDDMIRKYGKLGRSEGCFALSAEVLPVALGRLGAGRLIVAGKLEDVRV